ncbi:MAG: fabB [Gammaproteobacteria bacterium]|nr:fabB [Gammaproteobacteria bacterium]
MTSGVIIASNVLCSSGRGTEQLWAAVRAGISRIGNSHIMGRDREPIRMGLAPEDALEPRLPPEIELLPLPSRARRMLRLAAPVLRSVLQHAGDSPVRLFLGLPQLPVSEAHWLKGFALHLGKIAGVALDAPNSRVVPAGRAAALMALELALSALDSDPTRPVIVGGVDSFLDLKLLAALDAEGRILGSNVMDGFLPGEGAAFLVLSHPSRAGETGVASICAQAAASCSDPGHRAGLEPARGEGLAEALEALRGRLAGALAPVATTFAGLNGESFDAKLWGVARLRHGDFFAPGMVLEHPADCFGDAGAALGAILLALAAQALQNRQRAGPALVWAASDGESRACALLSAAAA